MHDFIDVQSNNFVENTNTNPPTCLTEESNIPYEIYQIDI